MHQTSDKIYSCESKKKYETPSAEKKRPLKHTKSVKLNKKVPVALIWMTNTTKIKT